MIHVAAFALGTLTKPKTKDSTKGTENCLRLDNNAIHQASTISMAWHLFFSLRLDLQTHCILGELLQH